MAIAVDDTEEFTGGDEPFRRGRRLSTGSVMAPSASCRSTAGQGSINSSASREKWVGNWQHRPTAVGCELAESESGRGREQNVRRRRHEGVRRTDCRCPSSRPRRSPSRPNRCRSRRSRSSPPLRCTGRARRGSRRADTRFREIGRADRDLVLGHWSPNFDHSGFQLDLNVVYPIDRLEELAADGVIGEVADDALRLRRQPARHRVRGPPRHRPGVRAAAARSRRRRRAAHSGLTAVHAYREYARPRLRSRRPVHDRARLEPLGRRSDEAAAGAALRIPARPPARKARRRRIPAGRPPACVRTARRHRARDRDPPRGHRVRRDSDVVYAAAALRPRSATGSRRGPGPSCRLRPGGRQAWRHIGRAHHHRRPDPRSARRPAPVGRGSAVEGDPAARPQRDRCRATTSAPTTKRPAWNSSTARHPGGRAAEAWFHERTEAGAGPSWPPGQR